MVSSVSMGGAGRSGDGLRMVSLYGLSICDVDCTAGSCMGYEWLAGLVWEGLGYVGFVYKIVEIYNIFLSFGRSHLHRNNAEGGGISHPPRMKPC